MADRALQKQNLWAASATPGEKAYLIPATDRVLDDATTLLAALRLGREISPNPKLISLLHTAGLLKKNIPQAEAMRKFLEASRDEALKDAHRSLARI